MSEVYKQIEKIDCRHKALLHAVETLTINRNNASCIERGYPRKVYDYFMGLDESKEQKEVRKIDVSYIREWEKLHDSFIGHKRPEDLSVCYLSGPEPLNDFNELVNLGVLPHNIWAFENDKSIFSQALEQVDSWKFPKPKILKMPIEQFFKNTPKKFDIIYIDACGAVPSEQHALRIISTVCKYQRLNSPGIIISNFARPDLNNPVIKKQYVDMVSLYHWCKKYPNEKLYINSKIISTETLDKISICVESDFDLYYGEFLRYIIMDIASIIIPYLRIVNSFLIKSIGTVNLSSKNMNLEELNEIRNNSLWKFCGIIDLINKDKVVLDIDKLNLLISEVSGIDGYNISILETFLKLDCIKNEKDKLNDDVLKFKNSFKNYNNIYQFLDKPTVSLFFDLLINQLAYPLHYAPNAMKSFQYKAKETTMFTDVFVLDECRYLYEWMPTANQIERALEDVSWQYVFRFALDGLVKSRIQYNNEFFFQGSVISSNIKEFKPSYLSERINIF